MWSSDMYRHSTNQITSFFWISNHNYHMWLPYCCTNLLEHLCLQARVFAVQPLSTCPHLEEVQPLPTGCQTGDMLFRPPRLIRCYGCTLDTLAPWQASLTVAYIQLYQCVAMRLYYWLTIQIFNLRSTDPAWIVEKLECSHHHLHWTKDGLQLCSLYEQ